MSNYLSDFEKIKNNEKYTPEAVLDKCPDCGNKEFEIVRQSRRGTGLLDRNGLYCKKCRVLWFNQR